MNIITFPNSPFILHQPFEPAGDQPVAIAQLVEGLNDGLAFQTLLGVTGSGKTFTMANVIAQLGRPAMVMGISAGEETAARASEPAFITSSSARDKPNQARIKNPKNQKNLPIQTHSKTSGTRFCFST